MIQSTSNQSPVRQCTRPPERVNPKYLHSLRVIAIFLVISLPILIQAKNNNYQIYKVKKDLLKKEDFISLDIISSAKDYLYLRLKNGERERLQLNGIKLSICEKCYPKSEITSKSYDDYISEMADFTQNNVMSLTSIGKSVEERDIYAIRFSDDSKNPSGDKPDIFFIGLQHAREWTAYKVILMTIDYLNQYYLTDERINNLYKNCEIVFVPFLNPDGFEYTRSRDPLWRKNRKENSDGTIGVDLNRNYDYEFYGGNRVTSTLSEQYSGEAPFSEPESQVLRDLLLQSEVGGLIDFHSYSQLIFYPWAYTSEKTEDDDLFKILSIFFQNSIYSNYNEEYEYGQPSDYIGYEVGGSLIDYTYGTYDVPALALELRPTADVEDGFYISDDEVKENFDEIIDSVIKFAEISCQKNWRALDSDVKEADNSGGCGFF